MEEKIHLSDVGFSYSNHFDTVLKGIDLEIEAGQCVLICGASGSGKSTLTRFFNGLSPQYIEGDLQGDVSVFGLEPDRHPIEDFVPLAGSVFQNPKTQHFTTTARHELAFPLENSGVEPEKIKETVDQISQYFQIEHLLDQTLFNLSGGQKQQLAFAAATVLAPDLMVLDEVTSNLDQRSTARLQEMVADLKAQGVTLVLTEHRLAWLRDVVDRVILLEDGEIQQDWSGEDFRSLSNEDLHRFNLRSMDLSPYEKKLDAKGQRKEVSQDAGLQTENLVIGHDKNFPLLTGLNLSFFQGTVTGIMGDNGRGKTSLAETLMGLLKPLDGAVYWQGEKAKSRQLTRQSFLVMQDTNYQLFSDSVESEVSLGSQAEEDQDDVLARLGLLDLKDRHPMSLSGGEKQRVAIASALLSDKEVIIFDEPTSGLDYRNMQIFGDLLRDLKDMNKIIIVITHDVELAAEWCDTIIQV